MKRILSLVLVVMAMAVSVNAVELVVNGGFENGNTGWHSYDGAPWVTTDDLYGAYYSLPALAIRNDLIASNTLAIHRHSTYGNGVEADALLDLGNASQYQLSFKSSAAYASYGLVLVMGFKDAAGNALANYPYYQFETTPGNTWEFVNFSATLNRGSAGAAGMINYVPADAVKASLRIVSFIGGYEWGVDDVSLAAIPEPATMILLSLGGLFLARKK